MEATITRRSLYIGLSLVCFGVVMRWLPHPANFAPVGAIALFGGTVLPRRLGWWLPAAVMALSDVLIGFYPGMWFNWLCFVAVALFGMSLRHTSTWLRVSAGSLVGGLIFFVTSNFGVWWLGHMYNHNWQGLLDCYAMGLPFLRGTLSGDFLYNVALFGAYALATQQFSLTTLRNIWYDKTHEKASR